MTELILLSLKIRSHGLAALVWCYVRRNVITGNNIFWPYHARVHYVQFAFILYCTYCLMMTVGLLALSKSAESSPPKEGGY